MPESTDTKLNPQVAEIEIGIRNLRTIKVYPLSVGGQLSMTDLVTKGLQGFFEAQGDFVTTEQDVAFVAFLTTLINENLGKIIEMVTDEKGAVLDEMTNVQAAAFAEIIFDMNYGEVLKNAQSLAEKVKALFPSTRPSLLSSEIMEDIGLKTSSKRPSRKVASPSDN